MPDTPPARALANQVMSVVDSYGYTPSVINLFIPRVLVPSMGGETDMEKVEAGKAPAALFVKELERLLGSQQFFGGANVCLADLHALPVLALLLMANVGLGIVSRAAPSMQIFSIGFAVFFGVGAAGLLLSLPELAHEMGREFQYSAQYFERIIVDFSPK
jgi:glutathione S-transferase